MLKLLGTTETNQLIFLYYTILLTATMCASQDVLYVPALGGDDLPIDCKLQGGFDSVKWELKRSNSSEFVQLDIPSEHFSHQNTGDLVITGVQSHHEGLYRCVGIGANNEETPGSRQNNVTVLGIPQFAGCNHTCCPQPPMNVTLGSSFVINISLVFLNGGFRGINQEIKFVRLRLNHLIFGCSDAGCIFTSPNPRYTHTADQRLLPWKNITVNISDSRLNDSGRYQVEVVIKNPHGNSVITILSPMNITVTEAVTSSHIPPSATIITSSSTQSSVTIITSIITVTSGIMVSSTIKTDYSSMTNIHTLTTAQTSSPRPTAASNQLDPVIISVALIIVLVPTVLFLGTLLIIFGVRHSRGTDISTSKEKAFPSSIQDSEIPSTPTENGEFRLGQEYNSKVQSV